MRDDNQEFLPNVYDSQAGSVVSYIISSSVAKKALNESRVVSYPCSR
jgi:hypothetical protein